MRDILDQVERWRESGERVAIATVIQTWGSAPRQAGSAMALTASGKIAGSVSGGCVESAVYEEAQDAIASGRPRLVTYGISDADAIAVGLTCVRSMAAPYMANVNLCVSKLRRFMLRT